jgi:hypothetical protein
MTENYFTLWDANMGTVAVLNGRTMDVESTDRSPSPSIRSRGRSANPRADYAEAHEFYIRDVLLNWDRDDPNHLRAIGLARAPIDSAAHPSTSKPTPPRHDGALRQLHRQAQPRRLQDGAQQLQLAWSADRWARCAIRCTMGRFDLNPARRSSSTSAMAEPNTSPCR